MRNISKRSLALYKAFKSVRFSLPGLALGVQ